MKNQVLLIPGPTYVRPQTLRAQTGTLIGHRGQEYRNLHRRIVEQLRFFLNTKADIFILPSSASGCMEAAIRNGVKQNVLCLVNGAFSERWAEIAAMNGKKVDRLEIPLGKAPTPKLLKEKLQSKTYDAVTLVLSETSTGARAPIEKLAPIMKKYPKTLFCVDGVSITGGEPINVDEWGIDVFLFGTQKALALPPGIAFMSVSEKALEKAQTIKNRGFYFDFLTLKKAADKQQTPVTPPITLLYATIHQLDYILNQETLKKRFLRHAQMAKMVRDWGKNYFSLFTNKNYLVNTLTTFKTPSNFNTEHFLKICQNQGFELANGYGDLKNKTFRIGHMGDHSLETIKLMITTLTPLVENSLPQPL
ncbi:MAG: aminotransferase, class V, aminotransferase [Candidatus Peregrinibacteria bacterium GW2011_GWE2_39_6]|nr:MAG: aminotransferase, class V, aminotransferase [Candidatus Peregrinibacteria bacterium GW2011_GWF2_39_17]KKR26428.1 MAG: aminotransferase, class V, aminotransferase [Candidatus Peregrinibacteria bacterium GW2011_GWE2_39_6]HCW32180.1 aminotransferase [Candidatus Peregrinibacteria bacterium]